MTSLAAIHQARILIVDDQEANVRLLDYMLSQSGYTELTSTTRAREVVPLYLQHRFDLIILDLHMPEMDGFDVLRALRPLATEGYIPVLVVTADPDQKLAALEAGARDFLSKPFDPVEALTRIRNLLEVWLLNREARQHNEQLEATVRLRTAELQRFRSAMDATADAIFLIDAQHLGLVDVNEGACRMLGMERAGLLRRAPMQFALASQEELRAHAANGNPPELIEQHLLRADQHTVPVEIYWQHQRMGERPVLIAVARDISERLQAKERLEHSVQYDGITGMPKRGLFFQTLEHSLAEARARQGRVALLYITPDRFKLVNEALGDQAGDELLRQFSARLLDTVRQRDTVGRLGGDEFGLILAQAADQQDALQVAQSIREALRAPFELDGRAASLTASIGIAMFPEDAGEAEILVKFADVAMERAKRAGRDGFRFFKAGMNVPVLARHELELALRRAVDEQEFLLYYQPKLHTSTGRIRGVEALLRWRRPGYGLVSPAEFVPVLEETGLIVRLGSWIIDTACRQSAAWRREGLGGLPVAVNVSSRQFAESEVEQEVQRALRRHHLDAAMLELELTESAMMDNAEHAAEALARLRKLGVCIAVDDFGTGYSSLAYLRRFPVNKLKIDRAFVREVTNNPDDAAIALAIIGMAHSLHLQVIAEGVETRAQATYLQRHRCDEIQGYYCSRPLPAAQLRALVLANRASPQPTETDDGQRQKLMIVDEDEQVLTDLRRLFRRDKYEILTAQGPQQAFDTLALHAVQVVLCDQRLGAMSGTEFLAKVKALYPSTVRIILAGQAGLEAVLEAINRGAIYRFYTKPWNDIELRENIRAAFQHYWHEQAPALA